MNSLSKAILKLLMASLLCTFITFVATPAAIAGDDGGTAGGGGTGGSSSDGCYLYGWNVVSNINQIPWRYDAGGKACGNSAYVNRRTALFNTNVPTPGGNCTVGAPNSCVGAWTPANAPLYRALIRVGAQTCLDNADKTFAVWYLQDAPVTGNPSSWTSFGINATGPVPPNAPRLDLDYARNLWALWGAIDPPNSYGGFNWTPYGNGTNSIDWWRSVAAQMGGGVQNNLNFWASLGSYDQGLTYEAQKLRQETALKAGNYTGNAPVVYCLYKGQSNPNLKCGDTPGYYNYQAALGTDANSVTPNVADCFLKCPPVGSSPYERNPGMPIPATENSDQKRGQYCFYRSETVTENNVLQTADPLKFIPYYWITKVMDGVSVHPAGKPTAFAPQSKTTLTPYGALLNSKVGDDPNGNGNLQLPTKDEIDKALDKQETIAHGTVNLTSTNKKALAEGMVMNVTDSVIRYPLIVQRKWNYQCTHTRTYSFDFNVWSSGNWTSGGAPNAWDIPCDPATAPNAPWTLSKTWISKIATDALQAQTPEVVGFWQNLSSHCNSTGFNSEKNKDSANKNIANNDPRKAWSGSAVTKKYNDTNTAQWGVLNASNPISNTKGFYNKICAFDGQLKTADNTKGLWSMFRDNELRNFTPAHYTPVAGPVVQYNGTDQAVRTLVTRWKDGTPAPLGVTDKGVFRFLSEDGSKTFFNSGTTASTPLTQWNTGEQANQTFGAVKNEQKNFKTAANWPSTTRMPEVMAVRWEYAPNVANTLPVTNVGFGNIVGGQSYNTGTVAVPIQGHVFSRWDNSALSPAWFPQLEASTGDSATNPGWNDTLPAGTALDGSNKWVGSPQDKSPVYQVLTFVRATTE